MEQPEEPINSDTQVEQQGDQLTIRDRPTQQNVGLENEPEPRDYVVQKIFDHIETDHGTL